MKLTNETKLQDILDLKDAATENENEVGFIELVILPSQTLDLHTSGYHFQDILGVTPSGDLKYVGSYDSIHFEFGASFPNVFHNESSMISTECFAESKVIGHFSKGHRFKVRSLGVWSDGFVHVF